MHPIRSTCRTLDGRFEKHRRAGVRRTPEALKATARKMILASQGHSTMGRTTIRQSKLGTRITTRTKSGNTTVTRTTGAGKKPKTTITTRGKSTTWTRSY